MNRVVCLFVMLFAVTPVAIAGEADTRTVIELSPQHRALVLNEMRQFLSGLQQITAALSRDDMDAVTEAARSLGVAMTRQVPADLKRALPQGFRTLGHQVHSQFDQIALDAESLGDSSHALSQLGDTLSQCVACHNTYQIRLSNQ